MKIATVVRTRFGRITFMILLTVQFLAAHKAYGTELIIGGPISGEAGFAFSESKPAEPLSAINTVMNASTSDTELRHENTMALIDTAMHLGQNCVLLAVQENSVRRKKPISLKELARKSDICLKKQIAAIESASR